VERAAAGGDCESGALCHSPGRHDHW
jgi:hypothetical protein